MRYNKKTLLLSAATLGLLTSSLGPSVVLAATETDNDNSDLIVEEPLEDISKENGTTYHIVRSGETVFSISKKYKISKEALRFWNNISNDIIHVNQVVSVNGMNVYQEIVNERNQFNSTQQFINQVAPIALEMAGKYDLYPSVMIAQATLETGSGTSELAVLANNYFGIKGTYKGNSIYKMSPEEVNGNMISQSSRFRTYPNLAASFEDNGKRLRLGPNTDSEVNSWNSNHYSGTWVENAHTYRDATQALLTAGYATDSSYAKKLNNIIETYNLVEYDKVLYDFVEERENNPVSPDSAYKEAVNEIQNPVSKEPVGSAFLNASRTLPSVASIQSMTIEQLSSIETQLVAAQNIYQSLAKEVKEDAMVARWAGYLRDKQTAFSNRVTALSTSSSDAFIDATMALPSINRILQLNNDEVANVKKEAINARNLYNSLSATDKTNSTVVRWAGYLVDKEQGIAKREAELKSTSKEAFVNAVMALPSVNRMKQMNRPEVNNVKVEITAAEALYNGLSSEDKKDTRVIRWKGYLSDKEAGLLKRITTLSKEEAALTTSDEFIKAVSRLPNVNNILKMSVSEKSALEKEIGNVKLVYASLPQTDKENSTVIRWAGYLTDKENAMNGDIVLGENFLKAVSYLPSVASINKMTVNQLESLKSDLQRVRSTYTGLTSNEKRDANVSKWADYLTQKEKAVSDIFSTADQFLKQVQGLPSVSSLSKMSESQLANEHSKMRAIRNAYNKLTPAAKNFTDVVKWEGYLSEKENVGSVNTSSVRLDKEFHYGVESGDTFNSIAAKFQVNLNQLVARNKHLDPRNLKTGDTVYIQNAIARPMDHSQAHDGKHVVYLDAGHGGWETGAYAYGTAEKDLNLIIANKLTKRLESMGYTVINVRTKDDYIDLTERARRANGINADIFVSLHHNALNGSVQGIETFYYKNARTINPTINKQYHNDGARLANSVYLSHLIQDNLVSATGGTYRRVAGQSFAVLRETSLPATLVEYGFMDNRQEFNKLTNGSYQNKMVNATADAIDTYFKTLYN